MAVNPRNKGQFVQAGTLCLYPSPSGSVVSHDGTLACDSVHLQADYPVLFQVIGTNYNDAGKGDDPATQFRTPPAPTYDSKSVDSGWEWRVRF